MPNAPHQIIVTLLSEQPELLQLLSEKLLHRTLPAGLVAVDSALRTGQPEEVRPDLVLEGPGGWALVEVQNQLDPEKVRRWLLAVIIEYSQRKTMGDLVIVTASAAVARWARQVAAGLDGPLGTALSLKPVVLELTLNDVEPLLDEAHPELAFFAAWAMKERHGKKAQAIVRRALELSQKLPAPLQQPVQRAIYNVLGEKMLAMLQEAAMDPDKIPEGPAMKLLRLEMEKKIEAGGRAADLAKGMVEGRAESVLTVLTARGLVPTEEQKARLLGWGWTDLERLERALRRAVTAGTVEEALSD